MATNLAVSPWCVLFFFVFGKWLVPSFAFLEKIVPSSASSYLFSKVKLFGASILTLNAITPLYYSFRVYTFFLLGAFFSFPMWLHIFTLLCVSLIDFFLLLPFRDIKLFPRIDSIWNLYGHSHIHCSKVMSVYYALPVITIWDYLFFFSWNESIIFITNRSANIICEQLRKWVCQLHHHIYHWHPTIGHF